MRSERDPYYLGIGSVLSESVTSKLTTAGSRYVGKMLQSSSANWHKIVELLRDPDLVGVLVKLTGSDYMRLVEPEYAEAGGLVLAAIGAARHLVVVHEAVVGPPSAGKLDEDAQQEWSAWVDDPSGTPWNDRVARSHFGDIDPEVQRNVHAMLERHGVSITTYKRNAEASVLAADFIEDLQGGLIFRLYVPAGRIYEEELARLLAMFHHWLGAVKGATVRQGGYQTSHGRVIEFFDTDAAPQSDLTAELTEFNHFLGLIDDPSAAAAMLMGLGVEPDRIDDLVRRYSRDARRVLLDARHTRDRKMLAIQQQLEAELADEALDIPFSQLNELVQRLLPTPQVAVGDLTMAALRVAPTSVMTINTQIINRVEGVVAQHLTGDVAYGPPVDDLLRIIQDFGGEDRLALQDAARQLADAQAPNTARVLARQRLKAFLARNAARVEASAYQLVWTWVQRQLGM